MIYLIKDIIWTTIGAVMEKINILTEDGTKQASAPVIISASRATDIPAFYGEWLMNRLKSGYAKKINPFSGNAEYISFTDTRIIVFWTKNPEPFMKYLPVLDKMNLNYYFLYTLNDYEKEGLEPDVPAIKKRAGTFIALSRMIGREKVIWRFDPLIIGSGVDTTRMTEKLKDLGDKIFPYTRKLIFSFAEIESYKKVKRNLAGFDPGFREPLPEEKQELAGAIGEVAKAWGITAASCALNADLSGYGIIHNACIDAELMRKIFPGDARLMDFLSKGANLKDKGQRTECRCAVSRDIGAYGTCPHGCVYCYANASHARAGLYHKTVHDEKKQSLI
jgi:DNA repair photolyase